MRKRRLLVAGFLGFAVLLGFGVVFVIIGSGSAKTTGKAIYRGRGRCYRVRFALHGALATSRSETWHESVLGFGAPALAQRMEWLAVADCHFVNCEASSLTASVAKNRDFTSTIGYGPANRDACEKC